jgi:hypothetical protein
MTNFKVLSVLPLLEALVLAIKVILPAPPRYIALVPFIGAIHPPCCATPNPHTVDLAHTPCVTEPPPCTAHTWHI